MLPVNNNPVTKRSSTTPANDVKPKYRQALGEIYNSFLLKYNPENPETDVTIPGQQIAFWISYVKDILHKENETYSKSETNCLRVKLINTSDTTSSRLFTKALKEELEKHDIKTTEKAASEALKEEKISIIISNNISKSPIKQAIDKCLETVRKDQYNCTIVIMLHITRKPPHTPTRQELKSCDSPDKYRCIGKVVDMAFTSERGIYSCEMNDNAIHEMTCFVREYYSAPTEDKVTTKNAMMEEANEDFAHVPKTDIPKPAAYIVNPTDSPASTNFVRKFQDELKTFDIDLPEISASEARQLDQDTFIILICSISSRTETDVDKCLGVIDCNQYNNTILIVLHVSNKTSGPTNSRASLIKSRPEKYEHLFQVIDMTFTNEKGMYECEMNATAIKQLKKIYDHLQNGGLVETNLTESGASKFNADSGCVGQSDEQQPSTVPEKKTRPDGKEEVIESDFIGTNV